jgi:two-component system, OmpR family, phosphate regulon sensor histidine kinase PhoR
LSGKLVACLPGPKPLRHTHSQWKTTRYMTQPDLYKLAVLVEQERDGLLARWRKQVRELPSAKHLDAPTLNDHIPNLLSELAEALRKNSNQTIPEALVEESAQTHGKQRLSDGYDIEEVVAEYNILRGCIHDLATENSITLQGRPFHVMNRVFDLAIGVALQTYSSQRALEVRQRREEYLAFVAHDLQTPLFAISLAGRVLENKLPKLGFTPDSGQMLKILRRSVQQLEGLARKVLEENSNLGKSNLGDVENFDGTNHTKLERREFDLWPLVESLVEEIEPVAQNAKTRLINRVPDDLLVFADAGLLKRVFQNLLANAIRYTPGGEIVIAAADTRSDSDPEGGINAWVSDNGAGIHENMLASVFDKGESDRENTDGFGLGLAIVKTFVEAHGGTVGVESTEGQGSTFRFSLPHKTRA